ncbi:ATP-dependent DNA ligase [Pseudoxanthomonas mexicana]|uniref:ATP-dependent DNA ligase n=1 Tax=Pseudoxanthomonas mexicana TaxID=128785 RepID=UPI0028AB27B3|nr:ATP-dependent DNA ligase [Pseudoxanthomonas mexicana]
MKAFAALYQALEHSTGTLDKRAAIADYVRRVPREDAAWGLWLLAGNKLRRIAGSGELRTWCGELAGLPAWLVDDSYSHVGDLAETLALLLPSSTAQHPELPLHTWIEQRLLPVAGADADTRRRTVVDAWTQLPDNERLVFNKLLTGALRVGVSARLVQQALADFSDVPIAVLAQRMLGDWPPTPAFLDGLLSTEVLDSDREQPYPFFLASPLEHAPEQLGDVKDWLLEWKWDGIRVQVIRRRNEVALWSRGEERLDGRFPEIEAAALGLPRDAVIDGELLAWDDGTAPLPFSALQTRIQRKRPGSKHLAAAPARVLAYDLLELEAEDLREWPLEARRQRLDDLLRATQDPRLQVSPAVDAASWDAAAALRQGARERGVEGLMLKRRASPYRSGRRRGDWWKWKIDPLTIDAVLLYAQAGHGRRSTLHTDYTFGVWNDAGELVPVAKAYSGLDDREILALDQWIRAHTRERFGPVRSVVAHHVFELGFEGVNISNRHKAGVAVRFPRILRWRHDKSASDADQLSTLQALAR